MPLNIAILGAGPAGLTLALALSRRQDDVLLTIFERGPSHFEAPAYNPDRSYTIDITGHGIKAAKYVNMVDRFDAELIKFKGVCFYGFPFPEWLWDGKTSSTGWTGSRGDICRALLKELVSRMGSNSSNIHFNSNVTSVKVTTGSVTVDHSGDGLQTTKTYEFDLIVGSDGGGSMVRNEMLISIPEFTVHSYSMENYSRMIHLDKNVNNLDPGYLYIMGLPRRQVVRVAGAINSEKGRDEAPPKWFCQVGTVGNPVYASVEEAKQHIGADYPSILNYVSDQSLRDFSTRECIPTGKSKVCSSFVGGRVVLLGDSAAPFPPIGQGVNAATEGAMVLDQCIGRALASTSYSREDALFIAAREYDRLWSKETNAITIIAQQYDFSKPFSIICRGLIYIMFGCSTLANSKKENMSYSDALWRQKTFERLLILTAVLLVTLIIITNLNF